MRKVLTANFLLILLILLLLLVLATLFSNYGEQQFAFLAKSFLEGKLYFTQAPESWSDAVFFNGKYFWPLGPFPALLLAPFVKVFDIFSLFFYQKLLQVPLVIATLYLVLKIAKKIGFNLKDSIYLSIAFVFASSFLAVVMISFSWQFSMAVGVFLTFLGLYEFLTKKRYTVIGLIYACLLLTRVTASLGITFFILDIILSKTVNRSKLQNIIKLTTPYLLAVILLFIYNYFRFGDILEQGYSYQLIAGGPLKARDYGLFSLIHIPGNLYYFLVAPPIPVFKDGLSRVLEFPFVSYDRWGMGILFTSPYFIYLFFLKYKDRLSKLLWITVAVIAIPIFLYYGVGVIQFGYRYSLDFLPYLFLLLIEVYKNEKGDLSTGFKSTILASLFFNIYLLLLR